MYGYDVWAAERLAEQLLAPVGRWAHVRAAGVRAGQICWILPEGERDLLVCAALLHDLGYAPPAARTGFHPLDGARYLAALGWPDRLVALVAHHSEAVLQAAALGLAEELAAFRAEPGVVAAALTYLDMTTGVDGQWLTLPERLDLMAAEHATDPPAVAAARRARVPRLFRAVSLIETLLSDRGRPAQRSALFRPSARPGDELDGSTTRDEVDRLAGLALERYQSITVISVTEPSPGQRSVCGPA